jgi:hypothetical protein
MTPIALVNRLVNRKAAPAPEAIRVDGTSTTQERGQRPIDYNRAV